MTKAVQNNPIWAGAIIVALILVVGLGAAVLRGGSNGQGYTTDQAVFSVERGPLTISVHTTGDLRAAETITLQNETEQRATIVYLVPEGTMVEEGELLVELDSGDLTDEKLQREINYEQARASYIQAREYLEVMRRQAEADVRQAEVDLELSKLDLEQYIEAEADQELHQAQRQIELAAADRQQARDVEEGSRRLHVAGYITDTEYESDKIALQRAELDYRMAEINFELLTNYSSRRRLAELQSDLDQKEFELVKVEHQVESDLVDAEATYNSRKLQYEREEERLRRVERQIEATRVYAPVDGMVIHATSGSNREPLEEGQEVSPRADLIDLPTADRLVAEVQVPEAMYDRIKVGLPVEITSDAVPGRIYDAEVTRVALRPDQRSRWENPDLTLYTIHVEVTGDATGLRAGMSCTAEIIVADLHDATYVPLQAVTRIGGEPVVYIPTAQGPQARRVELGLDNHRMVQINDGLAEGDIVLLSPPLGQSERERRRRPSGEEGEDQSQPEAQPGEGRDGGPGEGRHQAQPGQEGQPGGQGGQGGQRDGGDLGHRDVGPADRTASATQAS